MDVPNPARRYAHRILFDNLMADFKHEDALMMVRQFIDKWERLPDEVDQDGELPLTNFVKWLHQHYNSCINLGLHPDAD